MTIAPTKDISFHTDGEFDTALFSGYMAMYPENKAVSNSPSVWKDISLVGAIVMEKFKIFGGFSKYFQALGYTSTFLFHMIPAITDFLRRIPVGDPFVDSFEAPLLINFQLSFLLIYFVGIIMQMIWLKKNGETQ